MNDQSGCGRKGCTASKDRDLVAYIEGIGDSLIVPACKDHANEPSEFLLRSGVQSVKHVLEVRG